tara:strand:+ start:14601 stop:15605 length:1005 start_codon:yes stop_codon:yes gene_type:complete
MRWLLRLIVVLAGLWGGYWFLAARGVENTARAWIDALPEIGLTASHQGLEIDGFPNRIDLTLTEPRLDNPARRIGWQAPFLQILSLSYKPWHVIVALPPEQRLTVPGDVLTLRNEKLQASLVVVPDTTLALDRIVVAGTALTLTSDSGLSLAAKELHLATRQDAARANAHEIALDITGISPGADLTYQAIAAGFPGTISGISADVVVQFTAQIDRMMAQTRPQPEVLDIRNIQINWGDISLAAQGTLRAGPGGLAEGEVTLQVTNWEKGLEAAVALGFLPQDTMTSWRNGMNFMAKQSPVPGRLDLPLSFRDGFVRLGPLTIGLAPRLRGATLH